MKHDGRRGILLVTFGSVLPAMHSVYLQIQERIGEKFPGHEVRWAFTSRRIRDGLPGTGFGPVESPEMAVVRMRDDGVHCRGVLAFHVIPGTEFHDLRRNLNVLSGLKGMGGPIPLARPLLSDHETMVRTGRILLEKLGGSLSADEEVLLMGHGTRRHPANALYSALNQVFHDLGSDAFVGTLEAYPTLQDLMPRLRQKGVQRVLLAPLMAGVGRHVRDDMAGEASHSWKSVLTQEGFRVRLNTTGLMEYPDLVEIWLEHLLEAMTPH